MRHGWEVCPPSALHSPCEPVDGAFIVARLHHLHLHLPILTQFTCPRLTHPSSNPSLLVHLSAGSYSCNIYLAFTYRSQRFCCTISCSRSFLPARPLSMSSKGFHRVLRRSLQLRWLANRLVPKASPDHPITQRRCRSLPKSGQHSIPLHIPKMCKRRGDNLLKPTQALRLPLEGRPVQPPIQSTE